MTATAARPASADSAQTASRESARPSSASLQSPTVGLAGFNGTRRVPAPVNEPVKAFAPGSPDKAALKARLASMANERMDIPLIIGGKEIRSGDTAQAVMPHAHGHVLGDFHKATREHVNQ